MGDESDEKAGERVQSKKIEVIEIAFGRLLGKDPWPPNRTMIVNSDTLVEAIQERNRRNKGRGKPLSTKNPANFLKDFIRKPSCNTNWPSRLSKQRITARQVYGDQQVFEFIPFAEGDTLPFPDRFDPDASLLVSPFESLTIPIEARQLGRQDESWLIQVAVSQRLIATHLATRAASAGLTIETLAHLQVSVKTQPEIDATFVATLVEGDQTLRAYITVEAKQVSERILEHQIREQVKVAFTTTASLAGEEAIDAVLPIVLKVVPSIDPMLKKRRLIYIAQFKAITRTNYNKEYADALHDMPLTIQSSGLYEPFPPISGISWTGRPAPSRRSSRKSARVRRTKSRIP